MDEVFIEISLEKLKKAHPNSFVQPSRDVLVRKFRMIGLIPHKDNRDNQMLIVRGFPAPFNVTRRRVRHIRGHLETLK